MHGRVKRIVADRGFFFVIGDDGVDRFAHLSSLRGCLFEDLDVGDFVTFDPETAPKGPAAVNIQRAA